MSMCIPSTQSFFGRSTLMERCYSGVHSLLMLLQYLLVHHQRPESQYVLSDVPKNWQEDDGTMCLHETYRWRSASTIAWLRIHGLHLVKFDQSQDWRPCLQ